MKKLATLILLLALLVGCGGPATEAIVMDEPVPPGAEGVQVVELEFTSEKIIPETVTIPANTKVLFVIRNTDQTLKEDHNLVAPEIGLKEIIVRPGQTVRRLWTSYGTPGTYRVGCTIHSWIDMKIVVK